LPVFLSRLCVADVDEFIRFEYIAICSHHLSIGIVIRRTL
jgi:hypothetical protein